MSEVETTAAKFFRVHFNEEIRKAKEEGYQRCLKEQRDRKEEQLSSWVPFDIWLEGTSVKIECFKNSPQIKTIFTVSFPTCGSKCITFDGPGSDWSLFISRKGNIKGGCGNG